MFILKKKKSCLVVLFVSDSTDETRIKQEYQARQILELIKKNHVSIHLYCSIHIIFK